MLKPTAMQALGVALFFCGVITQADQIEARLIGGTKVPNESWKQVVYLEFTGSGGTGGRCTGTIVGPRTLITAAHCLNDSVAPAKFQTFDKQNYTVDFYRYSTYKTGNGTIDIAAGYTDRDIQGVTPISVGGTTVRDLEITLLGYGCTSKNMQGGNDGYLRIGKSQVMGIQKTFFFAGRIGGSVVCPGDSGGPGFTYVDGSPKLLGVISAVDSAGPSRAGDQSLLARLDSPDGQTFLKMYTEKKQMQICGYNLDCSKKPAPTPDVVVPPTPKNDPPPTPPPAPTPKPDAVPNAPKCTISVEPNRIPLGDTVTINLATTNATYATIDGSPAKVPTDQRRIKPQALGTFSTSAIAGKGQQTSLCYAQYYVEQGAPPAPPACTVKATPETAAPGEKVVMQITPIGSVDYASINGTGVLMTQNQLTVIAADKADFAVRGFVRGPGGTANCFSSYKVATPTSP